MAYVPRHKPLHFGLGGDLSAIPEVLACGAVRAPWEGGCLCE